MTYLDIYMDMSKDLTKIIMNCLEQYENMQGKKKRKDFAQFETLPLPYICVNICILIHKSWRQSYF